MNFYTSLKTMGQHWSILLAGSAAFATSTMFSSMKPVLLTRFVEQTQYSDSLAGLLVATPFVGIACSAFMVWDCLINIKFRIQALCLGLILICCELINSLNFTNWPIILISQFLSGVCVGLLMAACSRLIARCSSPDPMYGFVDMIGVMLMSFMIAGLGSAVESYGLKGAFLTAALLSAIFLAAMLQIKEEAPNKDLEKPKHHPPLSLRPILTIAMGVLFVTSSGLGFAFMFSIAKNLGMSYGQAGSNIGILLFVSAFACQVGGWCSARLGYTWPLLVGFIVCSTGWYMAVYAENTSVFLLALVPAIFALQFCFPILLSICGALDQQGYWAGVATPLITSGFAWAAITAGTIVEYFSINALPHVTFAGMIVCSILLLVSNHLPTHSSQTIQEAAL